jgi:hypothetical protein
MVVIEAIEGVVDDGSRLHKKVDPVARERSPDEPANESGSGHPSTGAVLTHAHDTKDDREHRCRDRRKDFASKVKSITCVIIPSESPSSMTLKDGVLRVVVTRPANGDWNPSNGWMQDSALQLFPRYRQLGAR